MNKTADNRMSEPSSRMRRLAARVVPVAALALAALAPTTAHAAQTADCPSGALCLYSGQNFSGERLTLSSLTSSGTCISLADRSWTGRVESAVNTHTTSAALFPNDGCLGSPYRVDAGTGVADLDAFVPLSAWVPGQTT
ncbi:peptidase inhibitor family I36 protein [Streptomyces roseolilacinus]|uniref:peptidase inhibitor family I36 protein n=1 Tax=Streptomyces roseolilacinus TaxID=66904 RepID=UPI00382A041D